MKKLVLVFAFICFTFAMQSQVKVISNGNVGMGVSAPTEKLCINGNLRFEASNPFLYFASGDATLRHLNNAGKIYFQTGTTARFEINGSSYIRSYLSHRFLDGSASAPGLTGSGTGKTNTGLFWPTTNTLSFATGGTERLRIDATGNVGIGTTSIAAGERLKIDGSWGNALVLTVTHTQDWQTSMKTICNQANSCNYTLLLGTNETFYVRGDGLVCAQTGFYTFSDESFKTNLTEIEGPIDKVMSLRGYFYDFNPEIESTQNSGRQIGLVAQEVESVLPEVVGELLNGKKGVDYSKLVVLLIEAFQEQQFQIEDLEEQVMQNRVDLQKCCPEYIYDRSINDSQQNGNSDIKESTGTSYLSQNNPNPFDTQTSIEYNIAGESAIGIIYIFDLQGN